MTPIRYYCRGRILVILSLAISWFILSGIDTAGAFDANKGIRGTPIMPSADHRTTRRVALERISSFLALANSGLVLTPINNPSCAAAIEDDDKRKSIIGDDGDLGLAQPMGPSGGSRPSAPLEFLLPAARVGVYVYQLVSFTEELAKLQQQQRSTKSPTSTENNNNTDEQKNIVVATAETTTRKKDLVAKLDALLLSSPPSFVKTADPSVSRADPYGKNTLPIIGEIGVAARKQRERKERAIDAGLAPRFFEVGELVGERRQWNQLRNSERQREDASEIRKAFNIYTTNLNFDPNKYQWAGTPAEKSQRIRSDKLPTTSDVIRSDLDARDLYRNQVQTSLDDAVAEFVYQKKESKDDDDFRKFDPTELLDILRQAQASVDKWFGFIPDQDVKSALEAVQREQQA